MIALRLIQTPFTNTSSYSQNIVLLCCIDNVGLKNSRDDFLPKRAVIAHALSCLISIFIALLATREVGIRSVLLSQLGTLGNTQYFMRQLVHCATFNCYHNGNRATNCPRFQVSAKRLQRRSDFRDCLVEILLCIRNRKFGLQQKKRYPHEEDNRFLGRLEIFWLVFLICEGYVFETHVAVLQNGSVSDSSTQTLARLFKALRAGNVRKYSASVSPFA